MKKYYEKNGITIYHGDCLQIMPNLAKVDMVLADLPYGTTYCSWDTVLPLDCLWKEFTRLTEKAMVFTSNQPFTTTLISSNLKLFKYEWIWDKENPSNFGNCNKQPLKQHENILVFGKPPYYPIKVPGKPNHIQGKRGKDRTAETARIDPSKAKDDTTGLKYPKSILRFPKHSSQCKYHPTQKPVDLLCYLIRTYTLENEIVLDPTMGSGSSLVAAQYAKRNAIGIEVEEKYCEIAVKRLEES